MMRCILEDSLQPEIPLPVRRASSEIYISPREKDCQNNILEFPSQYLHHYNPQQNYYSHQNHHHNHNHTNNNNPNNNNRVGTPYPLGKRSLIHNNISKKEAAVSRIPRLTGQFSHHTGAFNRTKFTAKRRGGGAGTNLIKPHPCVLKTEFYPTTTTTCSSSHPSCSSTTTLHYPRELTFTASPSESQVDVHCPVDLPASPPLVQLFKKSPRAAPNKESPSYQAGGCNKNKNHNIINTSSPNKALVICNGLERVNSVHSHQPGQNNNNNNNNYTINTNNHHHNKVSRNSGVILDREGFLQGPHTAHNRRIELYGQEQNFEPPQLFGCEQDRGDFSLPPLPPNVKNKYLNSSNNNHHTALKLRLSTATLSPENSLLEPHLLQQHQHQPSSHYKPHSSSFCNNNNSNFTSGLVSRSSTRSGQFPPPGSAAKSLNSNNSHNNNNNNFSCTSLTQVHLAESCTNLVEKLNSEPEPESSSNSLLASQGKCPLCAEKGQCHLHRRTMCSRYLTDLEWRICHAVNIYVYKNGEEGQTPVLVHIPPSKKKNMRSVMSVIQERICYPIGYAKHLYRMNGKKVTNPCELEMYNNYVVASNYDKAFKCVCYARRKSPLLVLAKESKHVRELRLKNFQQCAEECAGRNNNNIVYPTNGSGTFYACEAGQASMGPSDMSIGFQANARACGPVFSCSKTSNRRKQRSIVIPFTQVCFNQQQQQSQQQLQMSPRNLGNGCLDQQQQQQMQQQPFQQQQQQNFRPMGMPFNNQNQNYGNNNNNQGGVPLQNMIMSTNNNERPGTGNFNVLPTNNNNNNNVPREYNNPPNKQTVYTVNTAITTVTLKDPAELLKKKKNSSNNNSQEVEDAASSLARYKGLINDEESLFYSCKKKKPGRGVIDLSGEKKKIFYRESGMLNGQIGDSDMDDLRLNTSKYDSCIYSTEEQSENEGVHHQKYQQIKTLSLELNLQKQNGQKGGNNNNNNNPGEGATGAGGGISTSNNMNNNNYHSKGEENKVNLVTGNDDDVRGSLVNMEVIGGGGEGPCEISIVSIEEGDEEGAGENEDDDPGGEEDEEPPEQKLNNYQNNNESIKINNNNVPRNQQQQQQMNTNTVENKINSFSSSPRNIQDAREPFNDINNNNNCDISGFSISAPSRSYTVLGNLSNSGQNRHTQVTPAQAAARLLEKGGNMNHSSAPPGNGQFHPNVGYNNMYGGPNPPPSIFLSRNQPGYSCYPHPNSYFVQPAASKYQPQLPHHIQQIYPLEILSQRPSPYHHQIHQINPHHHHHHQMGLDNGTMRNSFRPHESPSFANCYGPDEVDIPFSPLYQRSVTMEPVGAYMQVPPPPSFVHSSNGSLNHHQPPFGYRNEVQPNFGSSSRNLHPSVSPIRMPSRRNVAVQMGEPSTHESISSMTSNNNTNYNCFDQSPRLHLHPLGHPPDGRPPKKGDPLNNKENFEYIPPIPDVKHSQCVWKPV